MRHAFLILAYNEIGLLKKTVSFLSNPNCDIYMNIDKRMVISAEDLLWLNSCDSVRAITRRSIHWGGLDMVRCELALMGLALQENRADYFHLLSGQDYPIKPLSEFFSFFERNKGRNYLSCGEADFKTIWRRLLLFQPLDWYDERGKFGSWLTYHLRTFQTQLGISRSPHGLPSTIYVGSQWFSISRKACEFVIRYTREHGGFLKRLRHTYVSDEIYVNTVLMNYYREEEIDYSDNLRFIRWLGENGNNPSNLGLEHFALLAGSSGFFARKMTQRHGSELMGKIDEYLLDDTPCRKQNREFNGSLGNFLFDIFDYLEVKSCLVVGDNLLYAQALQGNSMDVNGLYCSHETLPFLQSVGMEEFCQWADFSQPIGMEAEERFESLLMINQGLHHGYDFLLKILNSATNLANGYVLIIEENAIHDEVYKIVGKTRDLGFAVSKELDALLTASLKKAKVDASICLLTKK